MESDFTSWKALHISKEMTMTSTNLVNGQRTWRSSGTFLIHPRTSVHGDKMRVGNHKLGSPEQKNKQPTQLTITGQLGGSMVVKR